MGTFEQTTLVAAPAADVWARVVSPEGINHEMHPWLGMRLPRGTRGLTVDTLPVGQVLGHAWIFFLGIVPVDRDRMMIAELQPGRSFHEVSTMLSMQRWEHRRTLAPVDDAVTEVADRITFVPRFRALEPVLARVLPAFFAHRHRRLRRHFAGASEDHGR